MSSGDPPPGDSSSSAGAVVPSVVVSSDLTLPVPDHVWGTHYSRENLSPAVSFAASLAASPLSGLPEWTPPVVARGSAVRGSTALAEMLEVHLPPDRATIVEGP